MVVVRLNHGHYFVPRRDLIHAIQKRLPLSLALALAVLYVCEIRLIFHTIAPCLILPDHEGVVII